MDHPWKIMEIYHSVGSLSMRFHCLRSPLKSVKLKNVFKTEGLSSLSELEVEEVLEDVRLEFARFGTVKSVNVVKYGDIQIDNPNICEISDNVASARVEQNLRCVETNEKAESLEEAICDQSEGIKGLESLHDARVKEIEEGNRVNDDNLVGGLVVDEPCPLDRLDNNMAAEGLAPESLSKSLSQEVSEQPSTLKDDSCCHEDRVACSIETDNISLENKPSAEVELNLDEVNRNLQEASAGLDESVETHSDSIKNGGKEKQDNNLARIFEQGSVFVEYRRTEASCMAAHCLHGRLFDDRIVTVEYVPLDLYKKRFTK
ncbi:hypothetical protein Pint_25123 [Pistacia integerrima]|uniref:Uncharacterized protein n=1 Tax=Pistacia integerrima TaxID=434235 RepID=A0ACC0YFU7_9ROSI|nr:hypothetical protein Pint_25123 [Pistacia integerrima]